MNSQHAAIGAVLLASVFAAPAACLSDAEAAALFDSYAQKLPATLPPLTSERQAARPAFLRSRSGLNS